MTVSSSPGDAFVHVQLLFGFLKADVITLQPSQWCHLPDLGLIGEQHPDFALQRPAGPAAVSLPAAGPIAPWKGQDLFKPFSNTAPRTLMPPLLWLLSNQTSVCQEEGIR